MKVLITGANGFIGKNLIAHLREREDIVILTYTRKNKIEDLYKSIEEVDWIFHLAGINRSNNPQDFHHGNIEVTKTICDIVKKSNKKIPILYTSSIKATEKSIYGSSKHKAEKILLKFQKETGNSIYIYRLPNVFGKWSLPNYNSVVATFCYNLSREIPIQISDPTNVIRLVYIDDVIESFVSKMSKKNDSNQTFLSIPEYNITLRELSDYLTLFKNIPTNLSIPSLGNDLIKALYSTYVSYIPTDKFVYQIPKYTDARGDFVEVFKNFSIGQISYFTLKKGLIRGGHYHHSKTEKFIVIRGTALFRFKHIITNETFEVVSSQENSEIVETVPGWAHDIKNIGGKDLICMIWANEILDKNNQDTYPYRVSEE